MAITHAETIWHRDLSADIRVSIVEVTYDNGQEHLTQIRHVELDGDSGDLSRLEASQARLLAQALVTAADIVDADG